MQFFFLSFSFSLLVPLISLGVAHDRGFRYTLVVHEWAKKQNTRNTRYCDGTLVVVVDTGPTKAAAETRPFGFVTTLNGRLPSLCSSSVGRRCFKINSLPLLFVPLSYFTKMSIPPSRFNSFSSVPVVRDVFGDLTPWKNVYRPSSPGAQNK